MASSSESNQRGIGVAAVWYMMKRRGILLTIEWIVARIAGHDSNVTGWGPVAGRLARTVGVTKLAAGLFARMS